MVSVIIPVYNGQNFICDAIDSVIKQTYKDIEILVVDDGSTDKTAEIVYRFASIDNRIKYLWQENAGPSAARNHGIEASGGEYIAFLDADDILPANYLESLVNTIAENDIAVCGLKFYNQDGSVEVMPSNGEYTCGQFISASLIGDISPLVGFTGPVARMFRRNLITENNIRFNTSYRYGEDTVFNLQYLACCKKIVSTNSTYYHVNQQEISLSNSTNLDKYNAYKDIKKEMKNLLLINNLENTSVVKNSSMYFVDNFFARAGEILNVNNSRNWKEEHLTALLASGIVDKADITQARGNSLPWKLLKMIIGIKSGKALLWWFILAPKMGV